MGLFKSKNQKLLREVIKETGVTAKKGVFVCKECGRRQTVTYFGPYETWTCSQCKTKNYCS